MFPEKHHAGIGSLLVGSDSHEGFLVAGDVELGTGTGILNGLAAVKILVNLSLHGVHVDVANDDDGLQVGTIPVIVEAGDDGALEVADDLLKTDGQTVGVAGAFQHDGPSGLAQTLLGTETTAPLFEDDATFVLNLVLVEQQFGSPAVEDFETHLNQVLVVGGQLDVVDGLVEGGPGVDATAKFDTVLLQGADHLVTLVVLGTVEGHVLAEVGQTLLVVVFEDGAGVGNQAELNAILGLLVGTDVVSHAVGQLANLHFLVDGHLGGEVAFFALGTLCLDKSHATHKGEEHEDG